jgi:hypothetical protein
VNRQRAIAGGNLFCKTLKAYTRTFKRKTERKGNPSLLEQAEICCVGLGTGLMPKTLKSEEKLNRPLRKELPSHGQLEILQDC